MGVRKDGQRKRNKEGRKKKGRGLGILTGEGTIKRTVRLWKGELGKE